MTKFEIEAMERHLHLIDDMRLRAARLADNPHVTEEQPGTRMEREQALQAAFVALRDKVSAAKAQTTKATRAA